MEKRVILAFVLSFIVLFAFRGLFAPPSPQSSSSPPAQGSTPTAPKVVEQKTNAQNVAESPLPEGDLKGDKPEDIVFETPLYSATFSNVGGVLKSYRLKSYTDEQGQPLELVNQESSNKTGWPLAFITGDKATDDQLRNGIFAIKRDANHLAMEFSSGGIQARKELEFDSANYVFALQGRIAKEGKVVPGSVEWQGNFGDQSIPQDPAKRNAVYQADTSFKRVALRSLKDQPQIFSSLRAGVEDQYFLAMFLSVESPMAVKVGKQEYQDKDGKAVPTLLLSTTIPSDKKMRVYVGPKQNEWLTKADPQLSTVLDYGYFEFIAKPLVSLLLWIHSYIGNFGWSIILLTVVLNLVLFPLRLKQQVSMLKMQKIQPQMRRLQDQYKKLKATDPRRAQLQSEMMGLYKEHGVNPMGGCLPLLLQMPLLFAFYSALAYSIELRRAPWILWVHDLSRPDYIFGWLPVMAVLMAVAMFVQQKLTPTANVDPAQARMMMIMPLMFVFMFWSQSSGLVLYWLTGSIIGILQQIFINKYWSPRAEAKLRPRPS